MTLFEVIASFWTFFFPDLYAGGELISYLSEMTVIALVGLLLSFFFSIKRRQPSNIRYVVLMALAALSIKFFGGFFVP